MQITCQLCLSNLLPLPNLLHDKSRDSGEATGLFSATRGPPSYQMEIYIPPSRAHRASSISLGLAPELPDDVGVLEDAAKEIENAISHLSS